MIIKIDNFVTELTAIGLFEKYNDVPELGEELQQNQDEDDNDQPPELVDARAHVIEIANDALTKEKSKRKSEDKNCKCYFEYFLHSIRSGV